MRSRFPWVNNIVRNIIRCFRPNQIEDKSGSFNILPLEDDENAINTPQTNESEGISAFQVTKDLGTLVLSKENIPRITTAAILTGLSTGLNFLSPYLFAETIALLSSQEDTTDLAGVELSRTALISLLVSVYTLSQIVPNVRDQVMVPVSARNTKKVLEQSIDHLLKKSLTYHVNTPVSDQFYLLQKGFAVSSIGTPLLTQIAPTIAEISIACSVITKLYGPVMGAALFGILAAYTGYSAATAKPIIESREEMLKAGNKAYESFDGAISRYKSMRDFGRFDYTMKEVETALSTMANAETKATAIPLRIELGHFAISRISMLAAALYVGAGVQSGKFSVQEFVVLTGYLNQLSSLLPSFGQAVNRLFSSYPDLKFVFSELAKADEVVDLHPNTLLSIDSGIAPSIEFDNVSFKYPLKPGETEKPSLFQNLSFKIQPGQKVAFVSESGAGKTTIFNLLYGYYTPSEGTIKINGQDISTVSLQSLQDNITLFGQTPNLFKGSIRENICYGAKHPEKVTDSMIWELARAANLYDFLNSFPAKLETNVGESGKTLSGGQQQKVAVLRALFKHSPIRLLDEITAPFDTKSATDVLNSIEQLSDGVTTLMITHKLTEAQFLDQIFVLDKGKVIAQGTHQELLKSCELYQRLWSAYTKHESPEQPRSPSISTRDIMKALGTSSAPKQENIASSKKEENIPLVHDIIIENSNLNESNSSPFKMKMK